MLAFPKSLTCAAVQVDNPALLSILMRIKVATSAALGTPSLLGDFLIGRAHGCAIGFVRTRPHAAGRAGYVNDGVHPLDQQIPCVLKRELIALDLVGPIAGKAQGDKAGIGVHCTTPAA